MPLDNLLWVFIAFCFLPITLAGPTSTTFLSPYLSSVIPSCAHACLEAFIARSFPSSSSTCQNQQDLTCLCTSNSNTGFTLGEGALTCVSASCTEESALDLNVAYSICFGISSAISPTHTITATIQHPTTITFTSYPDQTTTTPAIVCPLTTSSMTTPTTFPEPSASDLPSSVSDPDDISPLPTALATATSPQPVSPLTPAPISSNSPTTTTLPAGTSVSSFTAVPANSSPPIATKNVLTRPQIAGIAVAGAATATIVFALLAFFFCLRKKRRSKRDSDSSFGADEIVETRQGPPSAPGSTFPVAEQARQQVGEAPTKAQRLLGMPPRTNENRFSFWRRSMIRPEDIGVAVAPGGAGDITHETSPVSPVSYRTNSELLPDKPSYSLYPAPLQPRSSRRPESAVARSAEGADIGFYPPVPPPKPTLQRRPEVKTPMPSDPFLDSSNDPRARMYAMERKHAVEHGGIKGVRSSKIPTSGVQMPYNNAWSSSQNPGPSLPRPAYLWEGALPLYTSRQGQSQLKPTSQFTDSSAYPGRPSYAACNPNSNIQQQLTKSAAYSRKSGGKRPLTHLTTASDTSFEDEGDDAEELPRPSLALSPVVESPKLQSPLGNIRYPIIPGKTISTKQCRLSPPSPTRKPPRRPYPPTQGAGIGNGPTRELPRQAGVPKRSGSQPVKRQEPHQASTFTHGLRERQDTNGVVKVSAKQQILCSPGIEGIENFGSPQQGHSSQRTPLRSPGRRT